jgi:hypothetical protein
MYFNWGPLSYLRTDFPKDIFPTLGALTIDLRVAYGPRDLSTIVEARPVTHIQVCNGNETELSDLLRAFALYAVPLQGLEAIFYHEMVTILPGLFPRLEHLVMHISPENVSSIFDTAVVLQ